MEDSKMAEYREKLAVAADMAGVTVDKVAKKIRKPRKKKLKK